MREFIFREEETTIPVKGKRLVICAELVRCKDCKHGEPDVDIDGDPCIHCRNRLTGIGQMLNIPPEWFCAYGERR